MSENSNGQRRLWIMLAYVFACLLAPVGASAEEAQVLVPIATSGDRADEPPILAIFSFDAHLTCGVHVLIYEDGSLAWSRGYSEFAVDMEQEGASDKSTTNTLTWAKATDSELEQLRGVLTQIGPSITYEVAPFGFPSLSPTQAIAAVSGGASFALISPHEFLLDRAPDKPAFLLPTIPQDFAEFRADWEAIRDVAFGIVAAHEGDPEAAESQTAFTLRAVNRTQP